MHEKDDINYEIRFFYDYEKDFLVKKSLIKVMKNYDLLKYDYFTPRDPGLSFAQTH